MRHPISLEDRLELCLLAQKCMEARDGDLLDFIDGVKYQVQSAGCSCEKVLAVLGKMPEDPGRYKNN
jgi:hypothetical protein